MKRVLLAATTIAGTLLFAYALYAVGWRSLNEAFVRVGWAFGAILALSGAREVARTVAWMRAVDGPARLSFLDAFRARLAGEALSTLLPMGMLVGEPLKAEQVAHRLPFKAAFGALALELTFYGLSLTLLFGAGAIALFPAAVLLLPTGLALFALPRIRRGTLGRLRSFAEPITAYTSRHPARVRTIIALEVGFHLLAIVEVYLTLTLISPNHAAWSSALVLETVSRAVTMLFKMLPMRMGVDEAGAAIFAGRLELGAGTGITLALVRKMRLLCWSAVGLALLLERSARQAHRSRVEARRWSVARS